MTLVSVLVPTWCGAAHLEAALHSALLQTHLELEVVIADDASPDGGETLAVACAVAAEDPRVRVIAHEANLGAAENQRRLLAAARGTFVKPLLQDDLLLPECVATLAGLLEAHPGTTLAFGKRGLVDGAGARLDDRSWNRPLVTEVGRLDGRELAEAMLCHGRNLVGEVTSVLFRRDAVAPEELWTIDGHDFGANADVALWLRLLSRGDAVATPQELTLFRQHEGQASQSDALQRRGAIEWGQLALVAPSLGLLADPERRRMALGRGLVSVADALERCAGAPLDLARAQAVAARLEAAAGVRGTAPARWPAAVAAPAVAPGPIVRAVAELRGLGAVGAAERLVLAIAPAEVDAAVPLIEDALRTGDCDLELVPTPDPAALAPPGWLVVPAA